MYRCRPKIKSTTREHHNLLPTFRDGTYRAATVFFRAFTVIEMLVVISIITLLIALLQPSLAQSKKRTRAAMCLSNQRQLMSAWHAYANDYNGKMVESWQGNGGFQTGNGKHWSVAMRGYYHDKNLLVCPDANLRRTPVGSGGNRGTADDGWKVPAPSNHVGVEIDDYGGFGVNNWVEDPKVVGTGVGGSRPNDFFINRLDGTGPPHSQVPVLGDAVWADQGWPRDTDTFPSDTYDPEASTAVGWMKRFCLDRHMGTVNLGYMDTSARAVELRQLWAQVWHKTYKPTMPP